MTFRPTQRHRAARLPVFTLITALVSLTLSGCGEDAPSQPKTPTGSTTFTGTVTGSGTTGSLTVTVATNSPSPGNPFDPGNRALTTVAATGTFTPAGGGTAVDLTGTWDDAAKSLNLTGSGWTFTGSLISFGMTGFFTGPGPVNGEFTLFTGSTGVTIIIGTFTGTTSGNFNFAISGNEVHGDAWETGDNTSSPLDGTYNSPGAGHIIIYLSGTTMPYLAEGDFDGTNASGTWDNGLGESGTWSGTKQ